MSNVTNMSYMFNGCKSLISLPNLSKWNTFKVTDMNKMFNGCKPLISLLDLSKWNIYNVLYNKKMFYGLLNCLIELTKVKSLFD